MKKRILLLVSILVILTAVGVLPFRAGIWAKQESSKPSKQKKPPVVKVVSAIKAEMALGLALTGSVEPFRVARLASPAEGPILDIRVREGDRVKTGDMLVSIGRRKGIDALIASLREELKKEEKNLRRKGQLVAKGAVARVELDDAKASYEKVRAQLINAMETAKDYAVVVPWDGVISRLLVREGEFVAPRTVLLEMYDSSSLVIRAAVPEKHAAGITADMGVNVRLDAYPDELFTGRIERLYPYLDPRLRTRTMEIVLEKPIPLLPGMFARLELLLKTENEAVVVPVDALVATKKGDVVFVVKDGKAMARLVETGIDEGARIQIVSGVQPGDKVVVAGNEKLKNGVVVRLSGGEKSGKKNQKVGEPPAARKNKTGDNSQ